MKRFTQLAILLVFVILMLWLLLSPRARIVELATVAPGTIRDVIEEEARTRLPRTHIITMPIDGRVLPIDLEPGDRVTRGETIARLETFELDTRLAQARERVRRLQGEIARNNDTRLEETSIVGVTEYLHSADRAVEAAQAQLQASNARLDYARNEMQRMLELERKDAASRRELDQARLYEVESAVGYRTDELTLRAIEAVRAAFRVIPHYIRQQMEMKTLTREPLEAERAEALALLAQAERDRARAVIEAPVSGIVLARHEDSERMLPAGTILIEIGELDRMEIEVEVLSQEAVRVRPGQRVELFGQAIGATPVLASVRRVDPRGFAKVSSLGVEQQRVLVMVELPPALRDELAERGRSLGLGYRVQARLIIEERANALTLPRAALFRTSEGEWAVFRAERNRARRTLVTVGLMNEREVEITAGLREGDRVILAPDVAITDGVRLSTGR